MEGFHLQRLRAEAPPPHPSPLTTICEQHEVEFTREWCGGWQVEGFHLQRLRAEAPYFSLDIALNPLLLTSNSNPQTPNPESENTTVIIGQSRIPIVIIRQSRSAEEVEGVYLQRLRTEAPGFSCNNA